MTDEEEAFDKCLKYLENIKTQKQVSDYLYKKGYGTKTVEHCMKKLREYKYVDDEEYAKLYVKSYMEKKGKRLLEFELKTKGISEEIIKRVFENFEDSEEVILSISEKFLKTRPRDKKTAQKLCAHLFSKGFNFDDIQKVLRKLIYNFDEETE